MINIKIQDTKGKEKEALGLKDDIFAVKGKKSILYDVVKMQLNNLRHGTACTKTRGEVNKSNKKPWRQKGTGRARAGRSSSPVWRGGGTAFGPRPRDYKYSLPKKVSRLALKLALSEKANSEEIVVLDDISIDTPKTKTFFEIIKNLKLENTKLLLVLSEKNENIIKSARNLSNINTLTVEGLNVYDILNSEKMLVTKSAINKIQEALS